VQLVAVRNDEALEPHAGDTAFVVVFRRVT
jgi:hypothetical protein